MSAVSPTAAADHVAAFSTDGSSWTILPNANIEADGSTDVQTKAAGFVGLFQDTAAPTAPATLDGRFARGSLILTWAPARDNSGAIASYQVLFGGHTLRTQPGNSPRAIVHTFNPHAASAYTITASDRSGNTSAPSPSLTIVPTARPSDLPRPLPSWAWKLLDWQQHSRTGTRPASPSPPPNWYWAWANWRLKPFAIQR